MDDQQTERLTASAAEALRRAGAQQRPYLLIQHRDGALVAPLDTPLVLGRSAPADVVVPDTSLSRQHAKFSIEDHSVCVEDLGSTNGTLHRGKLIERTLLAHGDQVQLGAVVVTIHAAGIELEAEEIAGHDRFVKWVDEELRRARFFRRPLCLAMVRRAKGEDDVRALLQSLRPRLRPVDRLGLYANGILELVAPEVSARELKLRLLESRAVHETLLCGLAEFPEMATSTEELVGAAWGALCRATPEEQAVLADEGMPAGVRRVSGSTPALTEPQSKRMHQVMDTLERVARGVVPVLLLGETGTGKEVLARRLHELSPRCEAPLVCVNCAAIPAQLVESALFGHEKGAFTGATQQAQGVFEAADKGTVFLDEIGELPPSAQAAILRVLETKRFCRVGATKEIAVDVRIVAATHRDLDVMVAAGSFRQDLLYRLNTVSLRVPTLRERREDIARLAEELLAQAAAAHGSTPPLLDPDVIEVFERYSWPGNVRELRNVLERAVVIVHGPEITVEDLPERLRALAPGARISSPSGGTASQVIDLGMLTGDFRTRVQRLEAELLRYALECENWHQTRTAQKLDMPVRTLVHKIKVLGIRRPPKR